MRIEFNTLAPGGAVFSEQGLPVVGQSMPVSLPDGSTTTGTLANVRMIDGGKAAKCAVDVEPTPAVRQLLGSSPTSCSLAD
ncbi:hypothetical protein ACFV42_23445 [Streptomyces solisilvae]|uniref:hypothetical protein n=1 Tax=Streptomyces malaysiensis TaxID=92644 RepID=UPI0036C513B6